MSVDSTNTNWTKTTRYIAGVALAIFAIFILYVGRSVIPALVAAALVAVIVQPIVTWLHDKLHMPRTLAVILVYLIMGILVPLTVMLTMPAIMDTIRFLASLDYSTIIQSIMDWLRSLLIGIKSLNLPSEVLNLYIDQTVDALLTTLDQTTISQAGPASADAIIESVTTTLTTTFRTAAGVVANLVSGIALFLFTCLASIYISLSAHTYQESILSIIPVRFQPEVKTLMDRIENTWKSFFRGQLTLMVFIGVVVWLGLEILGIRGAPYLGILAGLLEIVPNIGPVLAAIPAVIVALLYGSSHFDISPTATAMLVIIFYYLVQQVENTVVVPKVLGDAVDLPPLVVMTGVVVGAEVGGLLGVLVATPVIATVRDIAVYIYRKTLREDPFPPEEESETPAEQPLNKAQQWVQKLNLPAIPKLEKPNFHFANQQQKEDELDDQQPAQSDVS